MVELRARPGAEHHRRAVHGHDDLGRFAWLCARGVARQAPEDPSTPPVRAGDWTRERQNVELPFCGFPTIGSGSSLLVVQIVKPGADRLVPRGVVGGAEVSQVTTGATNIYMGVFRVPAGAQSRPHFHADCESAVYMLAGRLNVRWGEELEHGVTLEPGDMVYVPPRETHLLENPSETEAAEYVVARDAPQEDSVEVPWARLSAPPARDARSQPRSRRRARSSRSRSRAAARSSAVSRRRRRLCAGAARPRRSAAHALARAAGLRRALGARRALGRRSSPAPPARRRRRPRRRRPRRWASRRSARSACAPSSRRPSCTCTCASAAVRTTAPRRPGCPPAAGRRRGTDRRSA